MGFLKVAVVVMAILIVAGMAALVALLIRGVPSRDPGEMALALPPGVEIRSLAADGGRLYLLLGGAGEGQILILDARSLREIGRLVP